MSINEKYFFHINILINLKFFLPGGLSGIDHVKEANIDECRFERRYILFECTDVQEALRRP